MAVNSDAGKNGFEYNISSPIKPELFDMSRNSAGVVQEVVNCSSKKYDRGEDKQQCFSHWFVVFESVQLVLRIILVVIDHDVDVPDQIPFLFGQNIMYY